MLSSHNIRVVNLGCWELFDKHSEEYKKSVIGPEKALKISIEAGATTGWQKYTGINGLNYGIDCFGASAPGPDVAKHLGLTPEKIVESIKQHLKLKP